MKVIRLGDGNTHNRLAFFGSTLSWVAQINLVVEALICNIYLAAILLCRFVHSLNGSRFCIIGTHGHTLYAKPFLVGQKFDFGKVHLFLFCSIFLSGFPSSRLNSSGSTNFAWFPKVMSQLKRFSLLVKSVQNSNLPSFCTSKEAAPNSSMSRHLQLASTSTFTAMPLGKTFSFCKSGKGALMGEKVRSVNWSSVYGFVWTAENPSGFHRPPRHISWTNRKSNNTALSCVSAYHEENNKETQSYSAGLLHCESLRFLGRAKIYFTRTNQWK